jgi:hypothetical protein
MMGDPEHLYTGVAEFHGMPLSMLVEYPEWMVLLVAVLCGATFLAVRALRGDRGWSTDVVVLGTLALVGVVLTAQSIRTREYSAPLALAFIAVLLQSLGRWAREGRVASGVIAFVAVLFLTQHATATADVIRVQDRPTALYRGSGSLFGKGSGSLVLNMSESDFNLLLWENPDVRCVQGLSHYFLLTNRAAYDDFKVLQSAEGRPSDMLASLDRFWQRGVRLVAAHPPQPLAKFAERHPEILRRSFVSELGPAALYELDHQALEAALTPAHP